MTAASAYTRLTPDEIEALAIEATKHPLVDEVCEYMEVNPELEAWMITQCERVLGKGGKRISAQWLIERARAEAHLDIDPNGSPFRINNSYGGVITRILAYENPDLADLFEFRRLVSAA